MKLRVGIGYDTHRLTEGDHLWIGGVRIPHCRAIVAHSDGDVLIHAVCDALLGAIGARDIGFHFPDTSDKYKNIDSKILLERVCELIKKENFSVINIDTVITAQRPKLSEFIPEMKNTIARLLKVSPKDIGIKATTTEKLGFEGREEGISAQAVALVSKDEGEP